MITTLQDSINIIIKLPAGSAQAYSPEDISVRTVQHLVQRSFLAADITVSVVNPSVEEGSITITGIPVTLGLTAVEVFYQAGTSGTDISYSSIFIDSVDRIVGIDDTLEQVLF